jgi:hypothetical protein
MVPAMSAIPSFMAAQPSKHCGSIFSAREIMTGNAPDRPR